MKRIVSLLLTVAMLATMCSFTTFAAGWSLPTGAQDDNTVRFALIADSHLQVNTGATTSQQTAKFEQALAAYEGLGVDALVMAGDIIMLAATDTTEDLMTPEYNVLKTSLEKYNYSTKANTTAVDTGKIPVIYATGNHEYPVGAGTGDASTTALATFKEQMACEQNSHTVIEGIHFITSGGDTYSSYAFDNEEWIMQEVTSAVTDTPDAPVFLTLHHPVWGTVKGSDSGDKRYSQNFRDFLNANKNVIVLSAHTHAALCEPVGIWQDGFTAVTAGYVGGSNEQWSEGMLVEVNGSVATFYKMDLLKGGYIDSPWTVNIKDLSTYSVSGRANTNAPQFASGAKITVTGIESDKATVSWPSAAQTATGAYQDNYVDAYKLKVTDTDNAKVILEETYNTVTTTVNEITSKALTGLTQYTNYEVEVKAVSPFGKESTALKTTFTTLDPALSRTYLVYEAERNDVSNKYNGNNLIVESETDTSFWLNSDTFSGGSCARSNMPDWTWNFTIEKEGYYRFGIKGKNEAAGKGAGTLKIKYPAETSYYTIGTADLGTATNADGSYPVTMFGDSVYLTAGTHAIAYSANQGGQWTRLDAFHLYYDDTRAVTDAIIFEAEENNVNQTAIYNAYAASGGKFVRTNSNNWTWDFTPEKNGNYRFEAIGNGDKCTENGSFKVGDTTLWTGVWNTTPSWSCTGAHALVQELGGSIYLTGGTTYKLTLVPRGTTAKTIAIDYLKIYTDDMADDTAMLKTKVSEPSLYGVDVIGYGADGATATVTVNETHNGKAMSVTTNAVSLNGGETSTTTDKVGIFYMDEGDKIVSVNVTGDYTVEKISVYKMGDVKTNANIIEAEKYLASSTPAFAAKYGDYTSGVYNSGIYGSNISATYELTVASDQTYRFDVIGAADSTASSVTLTVNGNSINGTVRSGDWKTKQNYIGDFELTAGTYTITLTADNAVTLNAIKVSRGVGSTDIYIDAETGFDRAAGHGVGWYDNSPDEIDSGRTTAYQDTLGNIELQGPADYYGADKILLILERQEWYRYTVDVPRAGYYRILGEIRHAQTTTPFSVTANDDSSNSNTLTISRTETMTNWKSSTYTDCGLLYLNEGVNTIKFKNEHTTGYITLGSFRVVSPDIELQGMLPAESVTYTVNDATDLSVNTIKDGAEPYVSLDAPYWHTSYGPDYIEWTFDAPRTGTYTFKLNTNYINSQNCYGFIKVGDTTFNEVQILHGETTMCTVELAEGTTYAVRYNHGNNCYQSIRVTGLTVEIPEAMGAVKTVGDGTYAVVVDVTDWYGGVTILGGTPGNINWNAKDSGEIAELAVIAGVYDGDDLVNAYFSNTIAEDYKITVNDIAVEDGQYVKIFVLDNGTMTPLVDYTTYR